MARRHALTLLLAILYCGSPAAEPATADFPVPYSRPVIALMIDDMGENRAAGMQAIKLPGPVTYSFLPHRSHVAQLAQLAHERHKEVMLHLPMEATDRRALGAGGITDSMSESELIKILHDDLAAVPHAIGVNNHMGSLLTGQPVHMQWLMREIGNIGGLYFVDSRTTSDSVAYDVAGRFGIPNLARDIFLDNDRSPEAILEQFEDLIARARRTGMALGIGHPYPETIALLEQQLPLLHRYGVTLVPVSELIRRQSVAKRVRIAGAGASAGVKEPVTKPALKTAPVIFHSLPEKNLHQ